ncbi:transcriptional regulator, TetR family [Beutenbergia cavernae DSM 12333]|uniref:Transcriptional regulator, TetR family n=1 Tax=Beutenbergia cavernae (strain ATCC BAA-8 / DSM 12333 / CCUG 43141 / JCM 11478 / NBRC 16432 / NCIMB 13614 / HKI 0122) TaxID=471853 RepID=C5C5A7_BEUC1|nr:TetR/AcrR family transcriptional regulator [Beutenbergia cavernae]ACQ82247.1 transcriptional regulator, TetR family [Beutenbergia cavernae DSM 12333]
MARTEAQNAALRASTRDAVQTAAVRVFARHGFAASTIRQIALEAGLSVGSIYRHYATKDALFSDLLDTAANGLAATAAELTEADRPLEALHVFTERFLAGIAADDGAAEFVMVVNHGFTTDTPAGTVDRLVAAHGSLWAALEGLVRRGQSSGDFSAGHPGRLTTAYLAMLAGVTTMRLALGPERPVPEADVVLRILTKESPA